MSDPASSIRKNQPLNAGAYLRWVVDCIHRLLWVAVLLLLQGRSADGFQEESPERELLPLLSEMVLPSAEELLKASEIGKRFDWIVLKLDNRVITANAVYPRPDALLKLEEERKKTEATKPVTDEAREKKRILLEDLSHLKLTLAGDSVTEYRLPVAQVGEVILFEHLILRRVDELLASGETQLAYELLLCVEQEFPNWPSAFPQFEKYLYTEAMIREKQNDGNNALVLLEELNRRNAAYPELSKVYAQTISRMIRVAMEKLNYGKSRHLLTRLERRFPGEDSVKQWKAEFSDLSQERLRGASKLFEQKKYEEAARSAREAERIWPVTGNLKTLSNQILGRYQILRVAVDSFSDNVDGFVGIQAADLRHQELVSVPLFEPVSADEITYFRSSFFEKWEPSDLGREIILKLRESRPYWQSQPVLTANQIADAISVQLDEASPHYSPRLASFISSFEVRSSSELRLLFRRIPLNLESLFRFPVTSASTSSMGAEKAEVSAGILSTRFELAESSDSIRRYRRIIPEPNGLSSAQYHVAEIIEQKYPDRGNVIRAVKEGDADVLPSVLPWEIDGFQASQDLVSVRYALPMTHVIVFNPMSEHTSLTQLRRALSLAVDREAILRNTVLRDAQMRHGRVTSSVWNQASYASNPTVKPAPSDLKLAFALRFAAEKQLQLQTLQAARDAEKAALKAAGQPFDEAAFLSRTKVDHVQIPVLRMVVEADVVAAAAAEKLVQYWKRIGIEVQLVSAPKNGEDSEDAATWDLMYRRVRLEEPLLDLWPLLTSDSRCDVMRLKSFPDWLRQELIALDYAATFAEAQRRMHQIHRHLVAQAFAIPLWEVDDYIVFHKNVAGFARRPVSSYQNVERWVVRP